LKLQAAGDRCKDNHDKSRTWNVKIDWDEQILILRETIKSWTFKDVRDERDPKKKVTSRP
jgi:hypothetical protein